MNKYIIVCTLAVCTVILAACSFPKEIAKAGDEVIGYKTTYTYNVEKIFTFSCSPCHIPAKGGNKKPYDTYEKVKADIDEIIRRVELEPTVRGFMPMKGTKLSGEDIGALRKWKADGLRKE
jgi:mono/diheme cytochrome c family protein